MPEEVSEKYKEIMKGFEESKLKTEEDLLDYSTKQTYIACANLMTIAALLNSQEDRKSTRLNSSHTT